MAGIVGAKDNDIGVVGVAPGARLWAVRVLNNTGHGDWSNVICGVDWVTDHRDVIEVANMSLGYFGTEPAGPGCVTGDSLHDAICRSVAAGVTYTVAAGNDAINAANFVPAAYDEVITVSALADFDGKPGGLGAPTCRADSDDTLANFSNFGADVDLIAPGVCIRSTYKQGRYKSLSGTSMASPHAAGAAALYKASHPTATPAAVKSALQQAGNLDWSNVDDPDGIKETLVNVGATAQCQGLPATIVGTDGEDSLDGTEGPDVIQARGGVDFVRGHGGDDVICGGDGTDFLFGLAGNDTLYGEAGGEPIGGLENELHGGDGDDTLFGGAGTDWLDGDDVIGTGNDTLHGMDGDDVLTGGPRDDTLDGGPGNDGLSGGDGLDILDEGDGDGQLSGGDGDDTLYREAGNDLLMGGAGNDILDAGVGNDTLDGMDNDDQLIGGDGDDILWGEKPFAGLVSGNDTIDGGSGDDALVGWDGDDILSSVDGVFGNDSIDGGTGVDQCSADVSDTPPSDTVANCP